MYWDDAYPRPQLRRSSFFALHSGWTLNGQAIRVPWPPQAALSGYKGGVGDELRYETDFVLPEGFLPPNHRLMLHFGAVDQVAEVFLNGRPVIRHEGGYLPFSADVTEFLQQPVNKLTVLVKDTLSHDYPWGKQNRRPHGMWYTPVSGIWQTVWLEAVPERGAIHGLRITPDLTGITLETDTDADTYVLSIEQTGQHFLLTEKKVRIDLSEPHLWTPEDPFLYRFAVATDTDRIESYFALRTVTMQEIGGYTHLFLNEKPVFLHGVLDQGYFQDGLFLPGGPEEYERDIQRMKELGFNTLRKHIKIEPETFYYACDKLGMLVLQDMVNSGGYDYLRDTVLPTLGFKKRSDTNRHNSPRRKRFFERHVLDTLTHLYSHPCIVGYTIFNEGWGQYDSDRIYRACKVTDPSRFFVSASGWFAQKESDVQSEHVYFRNKVLKAVRPGQFLLLSECGGFSRRVEGHVDEHLKNYGYGKREDTEDSLLSRIRELYDGMVLPSIPNGLCGCIYTQLSDVEGETNGLYTYDRQVCKVSPGPMRRIREDIETALHDAISKSNDRKSSS